MNERDQRGCLEFSFGWMMKQGQSSFVVPTYIARDNSGIVREVWGIAEVRVERGAKDEDG